MSESHRLAPLSRERTRRLLEQFPRRRIALLGDLFLDRYLELNREVEYSIETGLEAYQIEQVRNAPGALGTVMNNLAAIGVGELWPITVIGDDGHGYDLRACLESLPVAPASQGAPALEVRPQLNDAWICGDSQRLTPTYTKPLRPTNEGWVELNRLDVRTRAPLTEAATNRVLEGLRAAWDACEGLIVLDQIAERDCGVVNQAVRQQLQRLAESDPQKLVIIDSRALLHEFHVGVLKGNQSELRAAAQRQCNASYHAPLDVSSLESVIERVMVDSRNASVRSVYCTDGAQGIWHAERDDAAEPAVRLTRVPGREVTGPLDIVGAGDSVTSALTAALLSGASPVEAAQLANLAASICVQKVGETGVATPTDLLAAIEA